MARTESEDLSTYSSSFPFTTQSATFQEESRSSAEEYQLTEEEMELIEAIYSGRMKKIGVRLIRNRIKSSKLIS